MFVHQSPIFQQSRRYSPDISSQESSRSRTSPLATSHPSLVLHTATTIKSAHIPVPQNGSAVRAIAFIAHAYRAQKHIRTEVGQPHHKGRLERIVSYKSKGPGCWRRQGTSGSTRSECYRSCGQENLLTTHIVSLPSSRHTTISLHTQCSDRSSIAQGASDRRSRTRRKTVAEGTRFHHKLRRNGDSLCRRSVARPPRCNCINTSSSVSGGKAGRCGEHWQPAISNN